MNYWLLLQEIEPNVFVTPDRKYKIKIDSLIIKKSQRNNYNGVDYYDKIEGLRVQAQKMPQYCNPAGNE